MKIEFEVTGAMRRAAQTATVNAMYRGQPVYLPPQTPGEWDSAIAAALAHPSFQSQLRAYVAREARRLVSKEIGRAPDEDDYETGYRLGHNECRATTLANIERWKKEQEDGK